ncbi:unnamed protein product [Closterium sp. NIES-54]
MALRPSSIPLRVPLPAPVESSLPTIPDLESNRTRAASPTISRLLATAITDPYFETAAASALVAEMLDFPAAYRLDYTTALVAESESTSPPSVESECALGTDVLEDRQEDLECLAAAIPRFASMLLAPEGDLDAPDIPTPRSYAVANMGPYSSNQRQGVDYFQTFSPTPKMTTFRVLLHVAAQRDYELHYLDFSTAFLQGSLHAKIWLRRPPGFGGSFRVGTQWSLWRPIYDLRNAPREWHKTVRTTLSALGFAPSTADPSLFLRTDTSLPHFYVLVYVDDLVFATPDTEALTLVKTELQKRHTCTDLGELRSYLGLQITRDKARRTITLTKSHMVHQFSFVLPPSSTFYCTSSPTLAFPTLRSNRYPFLPLHLFSLLLELPSSPPFYLDSAVPSASPLFCRCNLWYWFSSLCLQCYMPSPDSIVGASPLMDPRFAVPFSPPLQSIASHSPIPTTAALSLPRNLNFVLDSAATDSDFRDAGVLCNFPRPVHSIVIFITMTGTLLVSPFLLLVASTPFMFPSPLLSITLPLRLPLPSPLATVALSPNLPFFSIIALATPTSLSFAAWSIRSCLMISLPLSRPFPPLPLLHAPLVFKPSSPNVLNLLPLLPSPNPLILCIWTSRVPLPLHPVRVIVTFSFLLMTTLALPLSIPFVPNLTPPPSSFAGLSRRAFALAVLSHASILMVVASSLTSLSLLTAPLMAFAKPPPFRILPNRMALPSVVFALSWRSPAVSLLIPLLHTLFGATLLFMPFFFPTFALIPFALPLHPSSSGQAASPPPALFGCGIVPLMSSAIPPIEHVRVGSSLPRRSSVHSLASTLTVRAILSLLPPLSSSFPARMLSLMRLVLHSSQPSPLWSEFDPLPSTAPSPSPLPPAPSSPPLPAHSTPPSAIISSTSPSSAPMPSPSPPPSPNIPSKPAPLPSPRFTRSMTRVMSNFQHSALFTLLSPSPNDDLLEDRYEELFSAHPISLLLCVTIGDFSNSPTLLSVDTAAIPTPQTDSEAVFGFHATKWTAAIIAECEAFTETQSYVDSVPPPLAPPLSRANGSFVSNNCLGSSLSSKPVTARKASPNVKALTTLPLTLSLPVSPLFAFFLI